ncbi:MAG TPA: ATP-binding protein [Chroococcales cyanobacterium]
MPTPSLKEFAQAIPVCQQTAGLAAMLEIFHSSGCDTIVVVSEQQHPLGVVSLRQVIPYWIRFAQSEKSPENMADGEFHKPLSQLDPPVIEPLTILPAQMSLSQFWTYLQESEDKLIQQGHCVEEDQQERIVVRPSGRKPGHLRSKTGTSEATSNLDEFASPWSASHEPGTRPAYLRRRVPLGHWGLVDEEGKFLGLLDSWLILKSIAPRLRGSDRIFKADSSRTPTPSPCEAATSYPTATSYTPTGRMVTPQWGRFASSTTASEGISVGGTQEQLKLMSFNLLIQVLEQLPIPLSLQTATGQVVAENLTWRQQIGTSPSLERGKPTAARRLDAPPVELRYATRSNAISNTSASLPSCPPLPGVTVGERSSTQGRELEQTLHQLSARRRTTSLDTATRLPVSPLSVQNLAQQQHEFSERATFEHHCAIDSSCIAAVALQHQLSLSALPLLKTPETLIPQKASVSESQAQKQVRDRVFAFLKIPLLPLSVRGGKEGQSLTASSAQALPANLHLVIAQDTTEQQQVAKELAAKNADLVHLNCLKDEFLACISHELKTPLTAVLGLSTLLKDQTLGALNERQARYARLIYQSGRQLMTIVNDILDLTRMETGQLELTLEPVHIQELCDRAYSQARQRPIERDQDEESLPQTPFTLEIEPDLDMLVADELRLRQMLAHLLSNALKFTAPGGEIGLKVNRWEGWVAFTVWDTGIGIPPEKQHLIFQKFQQLEQPLTRRFEGTGLGLVLTQRLARLHGGDISFISKPDEGSQFTLLLPPCPPQVLGDDLKIEDELLVEQLKAENFNFQGSPPHAASRESRNYLVLIVETVPQYLESVTEQLKNLGYHAIIARSGTEAIEKARSLQPCAILLNPLVPQLSGWDVLTLLKSDTQTLHIPVLVTATQAEKEQAYDRKADGFLSLPVQESALLQCLSCLSDKQKTIKRSLTILHLNPEEVKAQPSLSLSSKLTDALSLQHSELNYRVLEADDLEQAELLARVWHPDVVLLDSIGLVEPRVYMRQYAQHPSLTALPLVTLDRQTTEAANQIEGLSVYPYLALDDSSKIAALLQVIQVAAGMSHKPSIVVMNVGEQNNREAGKNPQSKINTHLTSHSSWLQALIQYLQTAGFRSSLSCSWAEIYRQLQEQSVDLLLICLKDIDDTSAFVTILNSLAQLAKRPPIFVLDHRGGTHLVSTTAESASQSIKGNAKPLITAKQKQKDSRRVSAAASHREAIALSDVSIPNEAVASEANAQSELESLLRGIANQIWCASTQPMSELLEQINHTLR